MHLEQSIRPAGVRRGVRLGLAAIAAAAGLLALPSVAGAQTTVVVSNESPGAYRGPNWMLLSSGLIVFGGTYTTSVVVAGTSDHPGDKALYAPLVGPWMDIAMRCPTTCNGELGRKVLLGFDGVFQGIGALTIVSSFLIPSRRRVVARNESTPTFRVLPASYGRGSPGLTALGTF